jgi:hypothetical protein
MTKEKSLQERIREATTATEVNAVCSMLEKYEYRFASTNTRTKVKRKARLKIRELERAEELAAKQPGKR